jgi:hypothetical protein
VPAGSRWRGRERKRLGFDDEIQKLWFVARIQTLKGGLKKTSGRYVGLAEQNKEFGPLPA